MTPEQRADLVCREALETGNELLSRVVAKAIRAAVTEEREACADAANDHECQTYAECCDCRGKIAADIRRRR